jgi:hypothetical protein
MRIIRGEEQLAKFRQGWTGESTLKRLEELGPRLSYSVPIGVGKSRNVDDTIEAAICSGQFDLAISLLPTRQVLEERRWMVNPPDGIRIANLRPRPHALCGNRRDVLWQQFECASMGLLGRIEICRQCSNRSGCFWPKQYGKRLRGVQVIFATQAHLERSPNFITQVQNWTLAERILVLLDEDHFVMKDFRHVISRPDLQRFVEALQYVCHDDSDSARQWLYLTNLLLKASTSDLRSPDWDIPYFSPGWALMVQRYGWNRWGAEFKFLGFDLQQFRFSLIGSREKGATGNLSFAAPPYLNWAFVVFSGTANPQFLQFRLREQFITIFDDYQFEHPCTVWYNIASRLGMQKYFPHNSNQILDFFAQLVATRLRAGLRPVLIAKKRFRDFCARQMEHRLRECGIADVLIISGRWNEEILALPHAIPLITFGMIGTNLFEHFDCAYCLTGFYVNDEAINAVLQDIVASDRFIPIEIKTEGLPRRRKAGVVDPSHRFYDVHHLAQLALDEQEMGVVLQAVGRIRPYTRPREVVTLQCAEHPTLSYTREFNSIGEARHFFGIKNFRVRQGQAMHENIATARQAGLSQRQAAAQLEVSLRTVKRHWKKGEGDTSPF